MAWWLKPEREYLARLQAYLAWLLDCEMNPQVVVGPLNLYCTVHADLVAIPRNVVRALAKAAAGESDERKGIIVLDQAKGSERGVLTVLICRARYNSHPV